MTQNTFFRSLRAIQRIARQSQNVPLGLFQQPLRLHPQVVLFSFRQEPAEGSDFEYRESLVRRSFSEGGCLRGKKIREICGQFFFFIFLLTIVWKSVKILACLPAGKRKPPVGDGFSGEPQVVSHSVART